MAAILALALFTPRIDEGDCLDVVDMGAAMTVPLNCDSRLIAREAMFLVAYLTTENPWRTRPVHIFATSAITHVAAPVLLPVASRLARRLPPRQKGIAKLLPAYLAVIVINVVVIIVTFLLLVHLVGETSPAVAFGLAAIVASFDTAVGWFWVPHAIFLNILAPLAGIAAFLLGTLIRRSESRWVALLGLATAAACLTYGFFLILPMAFVLGAVYAWLRWPHSLAFGELVSRLAVYSAAVVTPLIVWFGIYYLAELEIAFEAQRGAGRQFMWVNDAFASGRLAEAFVERLGAFRSLLARHLGWLGLGLCVGATMLALLRVRTAGWRSLAGDPVLAGALVVGSLMLVFNLLQGYYPPRLHVPVLWIPIVIILSLARAISRERLLAPAAWSIAAVQIALAVSRSPVSWD